MKRMFQKIRVLAFVLLATILAGMMPASKPALAAEKIGFPLPTDRHYWVTVLGRYSWGKYHRAYIGADILGTGGNSMPDSLMDIAAAEGTPVYAVADGVVYESLYDDGGGFWIVILHDDKTTYSYYGHLRKECSYRTALKVGERVVKGQRIGSVGTTGNSSGAHLHFEISGHDPYCEYVAMGYNISIHPDSGASHYPHTHAPLCEHSNYIFRNDTMLCSSCDQEFPLSFETVDDFMDVIAVNKSSGSAPAHNNPYGDSAIERRYYMGDTLYVVSVCRNAYGNAWYKLSSGLYVNEDYLGTHTHNAPSDCFCTKCAKDLEVVAMDVTLPVKNNSLLAHFAPYGESADYTIDAETVKVTGKVVNKYNNIFYRLSDGSYTYAEYLDVSTATGYVNISDTLALNHKPASSANGKSRMLAELQPYSFMTVYPAESKGSWYSVSANVNGRIVCGYVYKKYVTIMETTKEIGETNVSNTGTTSGTVTNLAAKPTPTPTPTPAPKAKVLAPTNRNYTKKQYVGYTNAVLVSNIRKDAGTSVSAVGIDLFDAYGNLIKTYEENVIGVVGKNNTNFHSWFDVNKELRVNLSRRTTYKYRFYTIVEGQRYEGQMYSFTTK